MNPDERLPGGRIFEDLTKLPAGVSVPEGVDKSKPKEWYVQLYTTADGRQFYEFYRRGAPLATGQAPNDPVYAVVEGPKNQEIADRYAKAQEKEEAPPATRNINGVPHQPTKQPDGTTVWTPVPTTTGPATATTRQRRTRTEIEGTQKPDGTWDNQQPRAVEYDIETGEVVNSTPLTGQALQDWREAGEKARNPGGKTDAQVKAEQKEAETANRPQIVATNTTEPFIVISEGGKLVTRPNPNYKEPPPKPGTVTTVKGPDGKTYVILIDANGVPGQPRDLGIPAEQPEPKVTRREAADGSVYFESVRIVDGKPVIKFYDAGGKELPGSPDAQKPGGGGGPDMPDILETTAETTLSQIHRDLKNDPNLTPRQREARFQEAIQIANVTMEGARRRSAERGRIHNTEYNIANAKLGYLQTGLGQALSFMGQVMDTITPGSGHAGRGFKALMALNLMHMQMSGINNLNPREGVPADVMNGPGTTASSRGTTGQAERRPPTRVPTLSELNDPARLQALEAQVRTDIQAAISGPYDEPGAAPAAAAPLPEPAFRPQPPVDVAPALPEPAFRPQPPVEAPPMPVSPPVAPPAPMGAPQPSMVPGTPSSLGDAGAPPVAPPLSPPIQRTPPDPMEQFQAFQPYMQQAPQANPLAVGAPGSNMEMPAQMPASILRMRAQTLDPWAISEEEGQQMLAAGIPLAEIMAVPGRRF